MAEGVFWVCKGEHYAKARFPVNKLSPRVVPAISTDSFEELRVFTAMWSPCEGYVMLVLVSGHVQAKTFARVWRGEGLAGGGLGGERVGVIFLYVVFSIRTLKRNLKPPLCLQDNSENAWQAWCFLQLEASKLAPSINIRT